MTTDFSEITKYFLELDALKLVNRKSYVSNNDRLENSAEHSWHLAICSWSFSRTFKLGLSEEKLIKLALVHDLGEIDAGDTFLYSKDRDSAYINERKCVTRLEKHHGNGIENLTKIWEEQEFGDSKEAKLIKVIDRVLPFLLNISSNGKTWEKLKIKKSQVIKMHAFIEQDFPQIHEWLNSNINHAVQMGWLQDS